MIISAKNLTKVFSDNDRLIKPVNDVNLQIQAGCFLSIVGRSGSGKSTLLKLLGGILKPDSGTVLAGDRDIFSLSEKEMADYRSNNIGFVFQDYFLEEEFTVYQNLEIVLMIANISVKRRREMIEKALSDVDLLDRIDTRVSKLSGGQKQRVAIARAIVNDASVILADEPCGNLDYDNGKMIMSLLRKQCEAGRTVVLVTHSMEDAKLTDEIITLKDGQVISHEKIR